MRFSVTAVLPIIFCTPLAGAEIRWHEDYEKAYLEAVDQEKYLLISFYRENEQFNLQSVPGESLKPFVLLRVPASLSLEDEGKQKPLQSYRGFKPLQGGPGLAILNLRHKAEKLGEVVATLPYENASPSTTRIVQLLEKPEQELGPGTVTDQFGLPWHTNYGKAYAKANQEQKLLLVAFDSDDERFSPDGSTARMLRDFVLARLRVEDSYRLLSKTAFRHLRCGPGICVINLKHQGPDHGCIVQVLPWEHRTPEGTRALLQLADRKPAQPELKWLTDYRQARTLAAERRKMLLIAIDTEDQTFSPKPEAIPALHGYVLLRQSADSQFEHDGKQMRLLEFGDFQPMGGKAGLVVYDFKNEEQPYYGQVVSAMPYKYLGPNPGNRVFSEEEREHELVILERGTLTRRTLTWAIRVSKGHGANQRLRSADGTPCETRMRGALKNSKLQCRYGCGHHAGGLTGAEIAVAGPGEDIVDAALNMVRIWRGSPPHYGAMVSFHRNFGYDMAMSGPTRWYGTGRF